MPRCPRRRWSTDLDYCGRSHAHEHAALVSCSVCPVADDSGSAGGTTAEEAAAFFHRSVRGSLRLAANDLSGDADCDLPGCHNARRLVDLGGGLRHHYCCRTHSEAHLLERVDPAGGGPTGRGDDSVGSGDARGGGPDAPSVATTVTAAESEASSVVFVPPPLGVPRTPPPPPSRSQSGPVPTPPASGSLLHVVGLEVGPAPAVVDGFSSAFGMGR